MERNIEGIEYFPYTIMKNKTLNINNIDSNRINIFWELFEIKKVTLLLIEELDFSLESMTTIPRNIVIFYCFKLARKNSMKKPYFQLVRLRGKKNLYYQFFKNIYFICFQFFLTLMIMPIEYSIHTYFDMIK